MNKFIILTLAAACICSAPAAALESESKGGRVAQAFSPEQEVANLVGDGTVFHDFCLESRQFIADYLKSSTNNATAEALEKIVSSISFEQIAADQERVKNEQSAKIRQDLRNLKGGLMELARSAFSSVIRQAGLAVSDTKEQLNINGVMGGMEDLCTVVNKMKPSVNELYKTYVAKIRAQDKDGQYSTVLKRSFDQTGCLTTGRISKILQACGLIQGMGANIINLFST